MSNDIKGAFKAALVLASNVCRAQMEANDAAGESDRAQSAENCALGIGTWIEMPDEQLDEMMREAGFGALTPSPERFQFFEAQYPAEVYNYHKYMAPPFNMSKADAKRYLEKLKSAQVFRSDTYQVEVNHVECPPFGFPLTWLSIKRIDREAFHDWRELQGIKNAICGPEAEAVELYPADSRLVDTVNQMHLWVLPEGKSWPFGFDDRNVASDAPAPAQQRPIEDVGGGIVGSTE